MTRSDFSIIDSHHHLWRLERADYSWLTPGLSALYKDFTANDYHQVIESKRVISSVLVQAADTDAETDFLIEQANSNEFISGVVGWVDLSAPVELVWPRLMELVAHPKFKGIRPMLQDIEDPEWILNPEFKPVLESLIALDLTFDALVRTDHLAAIFTIATQYPRLKIVIDHCAKPDIANGEFKAWAAQITQFADLKNVYIKVSGLTLEANLEQQKSEYFKPYFDQVYQTFGSQRMMWGSDWPVLNIQSDYISWLELSQEFASEWPEDEKQAFWSGTANQFYQLAR
ncbi:amidohydrolase family protein [Paraglaciecola sp.]|uniref:amidohydrolase family protein n=1 Tax=Paraglaciecola sp. TaxID=1920173 RepID=UPI003EF8D3AD